MKKHVAILNYQDVRHDARVKKQANALADAGFNVTVFCNHGIDGNTEEMSPNGFKIKPFGCFSIDSLGKDFLEALPVFKASNAVTKARCKALVQSYEDKYIKPHRFSVFAEEVSRNYYRKKRRLLRPYFMLKFVFLRLGYLAQESRINFFSKDGAGLFKERWQSFGMAKSMLFYYNFNRIYDLSGFDIIHSHDLYTLPTAVASARQTGATVIYDAHEYEPERAGIADSEKTYSKKLEDDCLAHVKQVVTVSDSIGALYAKRYNGPLPIMIYNSPDLERADVNTSMPLLRERLNLPNDVPLAVYIGGISGPVRGVDKILKALTYLPDYHFVNLGPRKSKADKWLKDIVTSSGLEKRVHFLEPVPAEYVSHVVSDASFSISAIQNICLSYLYSMPNKLFEALFAGLPVCVPDSPDQRKLIEKLGCGIVVDQTDSASIARAMKEIVEKSEDYQLTANSKDYLNQHYSWNVQKDKLIALYEGL